MPLATPVPELLAPAGSLDSVRAAIANGADSIYLGAGRFNARDDGAQLTLEELRVACRMAHQRARRIYLTLNTLVKPDEVREALEFLRQAVAAGIDAAIVQDVGLITLITRLFPGLEIHGSTQMTVHDPGAAALIRDLGVDRVVLARENSIDDIRAIREGAPGIGLESFVHGALCISYSGQCFMSGMISERSANRGSCAQSCRKGYSLFDARSGETLDEGFVISARDLAAGKHVAAAADAGIACFKIEGRKKKPEYVATATAAYRRILEGLRDGSAVSATEADMNSLVQIFSRGFTSGLYGGRDGRTFVTRTHPDNIGLVIGTVVEQRDGGVVIDVDIPVQAGDGLGFDSPAMDTPSRGFRVLSVTTLDAPASRAVIQLVQTRERIPVGWRVSRSSHPQLTEQARNSYQAVPIAAGTKRIRVDATVAGGLGTPLLLTLSGAGRSVTVESEIALTRATKRPLDDVMLREQLGRMGETEFALASLDSAGLEPGLFVPVSQVNHLRQRAVEQLAHQLAAEDVEGLARFRSEVRSVQDSLMSGAPAHEHGTAGGAVLCAEVFNLTDAQLAADAGADEIVFDPFLRHPMPPLAQVRKLADLLADSGRVLRIRTPTIVRPQDRRLLEKWLALRLPMQTGHLGLLWELGRDGVNVTGDYALNCFNQFTAAEYFRRGATSLVLSIELTASEIASLVAPWGGRGFEAVIYGRPEGMTIEHCVLSAAFDREPTTCRDLCVQKHPGVTLVDPTGYSFPVATDSACRNRLLHSRPIDASAFVPALWSSGIRRYKMLLNMPDLPVRDLVSGYRELLQSLAGGTAPGTALLREIIGGEYTRGHYARAV